MDVIYIIITDGNRWDDEGIAVEESWRFRGDVPGEILQEQLLFLGEGFRFSWHVNFEFFNLDFLNKLQ